MWEDCHIGATKVMTIGKAEIYAGKWVDMNPDLSWALRIRLNDGFMLRMGQPLLHATPSAKKLLRPEVTEIAYPPTLDIDWEDFGTPPLDYVWWENLVASLKTIEGKVAVYCQGGHGRTGTALAILAELSNNAKGKGDVVSWVRRNYCEEAVESYAQIDYIQDITGETIGSEPTSAIRNRARNDTSGVPYPAYSRDADGNWVLSMNSPSNIRRITPKTTTFDTGNTVQSANAKTIMQELSKRGGKR